MATATRTRQVQLPIPDRIDNAPVMKLERVALDHGFITARYAGTGTLIVGNATRQTLATIPQPSPILAMTRHHPHVITVHANETIQVYNTTTNKCDQYQQAPGIVDGVRTVFATSQHIVALAPRRIIVWNRDRIATRMPVVHDMSAAPSQISSVSERSTLIVGNGGGNGDGSDSSDGSGGAVASASAAPVTNVLVVNANPGGHAFQLWNYVTGELVVYSENPAKMESFLTFAAAPDGLVVGTLRNVMYIWRTTGASGLLPPSHTVQFEKTVITAVYADMHMIIAGDNYGGVTMHTRTGKLIHHLTRKRGSDVDVATAQLSQLAQLFRDKACQIVRAGRWVVVALANAHVEVFDIFSQSLTEPVDAYAHPAAVAMTTGGSGGIHNMVVDSDGVHIVFMLPQQQQQTKSGGLSFSSSRSSASAGSGAGAKRSWPELVHWIPDTEHGGFGGWSKGERDRKQQQQQQSQAQASEMTEAPITLFRRACVRTAALVPSIPTSATDIREHTKALADAIALLRTVEDLQRQHDIELPFAMFQNGMVALDAYDARMRTTVSSSSSSSPARNGGGSGGGVPGDGPNSAMSPLALSGIGAAPSPSATTTVVVTATKLNHKTRDALNAHRRTFARAVDLIAQCADFLGDVRARLGLATPFSERTPKMIGMMDELSFSGGGSSGGGSSMRDDRMPRMYARRKREQQRAARRRKNSLGDDDTDTPAAATSSPLGCTGVGDTGDNDDDAAANALDDMLGTVVDDLGYMHGQMADAIEKFDDTCETCIHNPDDIAPLVSIYTKLRQLSEDMKETAKEIGAFRDEDPTGEWWEGGGVYDDDDKSVATASSTTPSVFALSTSGVSSLAPAPAPAPNPQ